MKFITKILDGLAYICVALLFLKYAVTSANMMFDWHLRWYFLEDIPNMAIILFILMFIGRFYKRFKNRLRSIRS